MQGAYSRFIPQSRGWRQDLPKLTGQHKCLPNIECNYVSPLNEINETYCGISRKDILFRAPILMLVFVFLFLFLYAFYIVFFSKYPLSKSIEPALFFLSGIIILLSIYSLFYAFHLFRLGSRVPTDMPVRFNRIRQKIYVYEYNWSTNAFNFRPWKSMVKVFDWADVQAEIVRMQGFTGTAYIMRQSLVCVVCKPGTTEAVDRFTLFGHATDIGLAQAWHFCCAYMEQGPQALPSSRLAPKKLTFNDSILTVFPYFAFGEEGRRVRSEMGVIDVIVAVAALALVFPTIALILLIISDYISMKVSPRAKWPEEIDIESSTGGRDL